MESTHVTRISSEAEAERVLEALVEDYLDRLRGGQEPLVRDHGFPHPELADRMEAFFPALGLVEAFKPDSGDVPSSVSGTIAAPESAVTRDRPLEPHRRFGDFRIIQEIGRGGMGVVYEAEQESLS